MQREASSTQSRYRNDSNLSKSKPNKAPAWGSLQSHSCYQFSAVPRHSSNRKVQHGSVPAHDRTCNPAGRTPASGT
eukprot:scaffold480089_cov42-Prasinocladus_malaysianus.AAC.2